MHPSFERLSSTLGAFATCVGLLAVLPGAAGAQSADTLHACYVPLSGTIYRTRAAKAPASCTRPEHVAFSLGTSTSAKGPSAGGSSSQPTDHGSLAGLLDDDHSQYLLADGVRQSTNGFAVTGTLNTGSIPASGPGARLMWYPGKAGFRAGYVSGDMWDDANIGIGSVALGLHTKASGGGSLALVQGSRATGNQAAAIGIGASAAGGAAIALGDYAYAEGNSSAALGKSAHAAGQSSTAAGYYSFAGGAYSLALGDGGHATGGRSVAIRGQASGENAIAIGRNTEASGNTSMALGTFASTNGKWGAIVIGDGSSPSPVQAQIENHFVVRAARIWLGNNNNVTATVGRFLETSVGAYLSSGGAWVSSSDSAKKHRWQDVDGETVLEKLAALPVRTWSYREEPDSVRHMGPTAQEFRAAFGLGDTDKAIATVDTDGVALVAAQTLERRTRALQAEIESLRAELAAMRAELAAARR